MRISAKGRYALASLIYLAQRYQSGGQVAVISLSDELGISKIYLEQVFSLLKHGGLVNSAKGIQGGYRLARAPGDITVWDVLTAVESSLFAKTEHTVPEKAPDIEGAMQTAAFGVLDQTVQSALSGVTLEDLLAETERQRQARAVMFYI